jgi:hypothetical protein
MGAGPIPLDSSIGVHDLCALFAFVFINLGAAVIGRLARSPLDKITMVLAILGRIFVPLMIMVDSGSLDISNSIGHGDVGGMSAYPYPIWMLVFGGYLMASPVLKNKN